MSELKSPTPSPLEERLVSLIRQNGPISVEDYMTDALCNPHDGYYSNQPAIGVDGDFITAPEISQVFGELIGLWLLEAWRAIGSPAVFNLVELGPGRGVLMADILRAARLRTDFMNGAQLWLLETSGRLRLEQQNRLKPSGLKPLWADDIDDIPPAPTLIIANEFFDCLPIKQFIITERGWRERLVGVDNETGRLGFLPGKTPPPASYDLPDVEDHEVGDIYEIGFIAREWTRKLTTRLLTDRGCMLVFDYGHVTSGIGDTLQAVRRHQYWPPLIAPGLADLTAHVNFEHLSRFALERGASVHGPISQGRFLDQLGLSLRVEMLCKGKNDKEANEIRAGAARIAMPDQMGEIFKTMCIASPDMETLSGFLV